MASGWAKDGAVQEQIDQTVSDAVEAARAQFGSESDSRQTCAECGETIPAPRRQAIPGVMFCVACQAERDEADKGGGSNRRASKDALLR
ncbi:DksA/TraR family C4-type zinc finger protein [Salinisphaera orenii]|uniref:DksA/TraR family C4-type zinc finger protein n=1 Tax=Salinisphaera orenii TaxID=856731 RepID=UPI000DBE8938